jgi:FtsP/CotA-like multicopper oxidase with cupredoxin domain
MMEHFMKNAYLLGVLVPLALPLALGAAPAAVAATAPAKGSVEPAGEAFGNPPVLNNSDSPRAGSLLLRQPQAAPRPHTGQVRNYDLFVAFTDGYIRNPAQGRPDPVRLRSYRGTDVDPNHPYVAPTIEATPGDTVRIKLQNQLPPDPDCNTQAQADINNPHCFNGTNLHSHGVWVSPTGNSDNVLVSINPGVTFEYEYNIPADHPAGTFWYHPHRHGSTALQVGSGMAGALIIRGDRPPTKDANGDLDTLLKSPQGVAMTERVLLFEQIPYACTKDGKLKYIDPEKKTVDWSCAPGEVGEIVSYDQFGPGTWEQSGRFTTVNGRVRPIFANAKTGETERWRLIHGGVRSPITVEFRKLDVTDFFQREKTLSAADQDRFAKERCTGQPVPYILAAADGLTLNEGQVRTSVPMQPGYRDDLLVNFPEPGIYCVVNKPSAANASPDQTATSTGVLGFVRVKGDRVVKDPVKEIIRQLSVNATKYAPAVAREVIGDLSARCPEKAMGGKTMVDTPYCPRFTRFTAHPPITEHEVVHQPKQELVFYINIPPKGATRTNPLFQVSNSFEVVQNPDGTYGPKGASAYQPGVVDRPVVLGTAQQWELQSYFVSHPFHIHVNPFQIVSIIGPDGRDVSEAGSGDPDYAGMKGVWKDTIWVKSDISQPLSSTEPPKGTYKVTVRTRYERFIGEYVLHCHILDHEDQGMMQNVSIGVPDGRGGLAGAHH